MLGNSECCLCLLPWTRWSWKTNDVHLCVAVHGMVVQNVLPRCTYLLLWTARTFEKHEFASLIGAVNSACWFWKPNLSVFVYRGEWPTMLNNRRCCIYLLPWTAVHEKQPKTLHVIVALSHSRFWKLTIVHGLYCLWPKNMKPVNFALIYYCERSNIWKTHYLSFMTMTYTVRLCYKSLMFDEIQGRGRSPKNMGYLEGARTPNIQRSQRLHRPPPHISSPLSTKDCST